jgi:hypothetical protein
VCGCSGEDLESPGLVRRSGTSAGASSVEVLVDCSSRGVLKHGTSGGLALALAMVAGAFGRELYDDMVITGEISLAGVVLPVERDERPRCGAWRRRRTTHLMLPAGERQVLLWPRTAQGRIASASRWSATPSVRLVPVTNFLQAVDLACGPQAR